MWSATGVTARADTIGPAAYAARLSQASVLVQQARRASAGERETLLARARELVRQTTAVQLPDGQLTVDDGPLADRLTADRVDAAAAELERYAALAAASVARRVDAATADATLRSLMQQQLRSGQGVTLGAIAAALLRRFGQWVYDLVGRPDPALLLNAQAVVGVLVALAIVAVLVRGTRERIRRETSLGATAGERRADPAAHLRAADEALHAGRAREAIHSLYLFALNALDAREALRYDPALTDHELLRRAAQLPHASALADLVMLHERVWFGLRDAGEPDVARARALALEAVR